MTSRLDILNELREISPLVAGIEPVNPYTVPVGYFEGFPGQLLKVVKVDDPGAREELEALSPLLSGLSRQVPYDLPDNYFTDLSDQALVGAKAIEFVNVELENLSPLMNSLKAKNVYDVPEGYFDSLSQQILARAKKQQPAKVIQLKPFRKIARYAVAAVLIGILAVAGWLMMPVADPMQGNVFAKVSDAEIQNFIQNDELPIGENVLSTDDEMDEADMKAMLVDISDSELEQFEKETTDQNNTLSN